MEVVTGRKREFDFQNRIILGRPEEKWILGMLIELGERMYDQIKYIPKEVLDSVPKGSYLSTSRVVLHTIAMEIRRFHLVFPNFIDPEYYAAISKIDSKNIATFPTKEFDCVDLLERYIEFRNQLIINWNPDLVCFDEPVDDPALLDKRSVLGHLIWHWSYHSGHIGAITLELGYDYNWTSKAKL